LSPRRAGGGGADQPRGARRAARVRGERAPWPTHAVEGRRGSRRHTRGCHGRIRGCGACHRRPHGACPRESGPGGLSREVERGAAATLAAATDAFVAVALATGVLMVRAPERVDQVGSHGRWKGPRLRTSPEIKQDKVTPLTVLRVRTARGRHSGVDSGRATRAPADPAAGAVRVPRRRRATPAAGGVLQRSTAAVGHQTAGVCAAGDRGACAGCRRRRPHHRYVRAPLWCHTLGPHTLSTRCGLGSHWGDVALNGGRWALHTVRQIRLSNAGLPLAVLGNRTTLGFDPAMRCWLRLADDAFVGSAFASTYTLGAGGTGAELAAMQVRRSCLTLFNRVEILHHHPCVTVVCPSRCPGSGPRTPDGATHRCPPS
jgi:hypothetical protein